mmetsp:Transcript_32979/g.61496  ORF Transcript_32979/g.61496 Transcript_32979/m.61496 type:complete len:82 (-) Transcript_32979:1179-1424(-)
MTTPCGLTQEKLDTHNWVDEEGRCAAPYEDENGVEKVGCGKLYTSHPSSAQQSPLSLFEVIKKKYWCHTDAFGSGVSSNLS